MPLQNRVTPFGEIIAAPGRGLMMGNRGVLHDDRSRIARSSGVRRWIACRLDFRGRHRVVMQPRRYTELFFIDEAAAFSAGHRPCRECRYAAYKRFQSLWYVALDGSGWLVWGSELLAWSDAGYAARRTRPARGLVDVLTPPSIVAVLSAGYRSGVHPTALRDGRSMPARLQ
jgi:hypothetical protein